jgi:hypothetical protein
MKLSYVLCFAALVSSPALASEEFTGFYSFSPMESAADVGLGGATLARFAAPGSQFGNPAALPFYDKSLGLGAGIPSATKLPSGEREIRQAASVGANVRTATPWGALGVGAGVANSEISSSVQALGSARLAYSARDFEVKPAIGLRLFDELSLGFGPVFSFGGEKIAQERPSLRIEEHAYSGRAWQVGMLYSEAWFRAAATWQSDAVLETRQKVVPFEGAALGSPYKPAKLAMGIGFSLPAAFHGSMFPLKSEIMAQLDAFYFPSLPEGAKLYRPGTRVYNQSYALYAPYETTPKRREQQLNIKSAAVPRLAIETRLLAIDGFRVNVNAGGYMTPAYGEGDQKSTHTTGGIALSFWGVRAEAAVDTAPGYRHFQFGLGAAYLR